MTTGHPITNVPLLALPTVRATTTTVQVVLCYLKLGVFQRFPATFSSLCMIEYVEM